MRGSIGTAGHVDKAVQALGATLTERLDQVDSSAVQGLQDALGPLRELIEAQAGQLQELRAELQEERERRSWWRRLFGVSRGGDDR